MGIWYNNFKKSFKDHGGHDGPETIKAMRPYIRACSNLKMTGKQAGYACALHYRAYTEAQNCKELAEIRNQS